MKLNNKHRGLVLSSTFVGLVCGLVLTHQQAYAAQTPPVSNQQSQITTVSDNNLNQAAAVNPKSYSSNISHPAPVSYNVTPSTYSSPDITTTSKQEPASSDSTADAPIPNTGATGPAGNGTATSTNPENNNSANPATSSPTQDTGNSATTPTASADNQTNDNSNTTAASSEQPETNIIAQGTWGTSKWDYTQEGDDYILHLYAGTLGTPIKDSGYYDRGIGSLNEAFDNQLTQIVIDPGVIANKNSSGLFRDLKKLKTIQGLENLDTSQVTDMSHMFHNCMELTSLDVSHFDTPQVTDMSNMFLSCVDLTYLDVSHFDTSKVTSMWKMFADCEKLTSLDLSHFDTSQVTNMEQMFSYCKNLTSLDLSHFDTSQVTNMRAMFSDCQRLTSLDVSHFDTSKVTFMHFMFEDCWGLTNLDVSRLDTSQVTDMHEMFADCKNLTSLDLSSFDTSKVTDAYGMLAGCINLYHLVLGPKTQLIGRSGWISELPAVPATGTKIPGTDKVVTAPYWVATSGYQQGKRYTSAELEQLTGRDQMTTYDWDSQVHYQETIESKLVTRTINIHYPDGQMKIFQDTVHLSRKIKVKTDGSKVYGDWSQDQWKSYDAPQIAGYQASQSNIPAQTVDSNTTDTTIDILYEPLAQTIVIQYLDQGQVVGTQKLIGYTGETLIPNYHAPQGYEITSSPQPNITVDATGTQIIQVNVNHKITQSAETLTKTRTINIHLPNATVKTYRQVAVIKRNVAVDQVTGSKTYGPWHNNSWDAMDIPIIEGYTANQNSIAAQEVTSETENETIDIFYVQK